MVLTVLLLGLGTQRASVGLMDLVDEWMPSRRAIPVLAPIVICLLGELLLDLGEASFSGVFNAAGIATNVVLGLALPVLLLRVSRRTGDLTPGLVVPLLGRRPVAVGLLLADAALLVALMSALGDDRLLRVVAFLALVALVALVWLSREPRRKTSDAAPVFADAPHEG